MGHLQKIENNGVRKGSWTEEEDALLRKCIEKFGEGDWPFVPFKAGLRRCRKSCRMRWLNYLHPNIKRGEFEEDEVDLIIRLHKLLGNRWSLIAGRIPGRTANDIKNYWNSHLNKKHERETNLEKSQTGNTKTKVIKPQARRFSSSSKWLNGFGSSAGVISTNATLPAAQEDSISWWKRLLAVEEEEELPESFWVEEEERMEKGGGGGGGGGGGEMMEVGAWDDIELDLDIWGLLGT